MPLKENSFLDNLLRYDDDDYTQIAGVTKFANKAVLTIWLAGAVSFLVFILYFEFLSPTTPPFGSADNARAGRYSHDNESAAFSQKTTLVNIGLKLRDGGDGDYKPLNGSISIHKINYDQQLRKAVRSHPTDFTVRKVPK